MDSIISNSLSLIVLISSTVLGFLVSREVSKRAKEIKQISDRLKAVKENNKLRAWQSDSIGKITFTTFFFLIFVHIISIGGTLMDKTNEVITQLDTKVKSIEDDHGNRIKKLEDVVFPPGGPGTPTVWETMQENITRIDGRQKKIEETLFQVSVPDSEVEMKVEKLREEIECLKEELEKLKAMIPTKASASYGQATM